MYQLKKVEMRFVNVCKHMLFMFSICTRVCYSTLIFECSS